jgi:type IV secretory pathway VirB4 component
MMTVDVGRAEKGRARIVLNPAVRIFGSPNAGKSTLLETIAFRAHEQQPKMSINIISCSGKFDYALPFQFEYYSPIQSIEAMMKRLRELDFEMHKTLQSMQDSNQKDVTKVGEYKPSLLIIDESESVESLLDKKHRQEFATLVTRRINGARKTNGYSVIATQSQTLDALEISTRSIQTTIIGRPQTKQICQSLQIDEEYHLDYKLEKGRLLWIASGDCQVIIVDKVV